MTTDTPDLPATIARLREELADLAERRARFAARTLCQEALDAAEEEARSRAFEALPALLTAAESLGEAEVTADRDQARADLAASRARVAEVETERDRFQRLNSERFDRLMRIHYCECCEQLIDPKAWDGYYHSCGGCATCVSLEHEDCHHGACLNPEAKR